MPFSSAAGLQSTASTPDRRNPVQSHARSVDGPHSAEHQRALRLLERFARHDRAVILLEGEPGTGKTSLARYIHEHSPRAHRTFHRVDLGTLDEALSGSDVFGHASGAFTGASGRRHGHVVSAEGGTLFLDELGKAPLSIQRKLLHLIEYGEVTAVGTDRPVRVDVRIVAATNVSLESLVERGEFLPDLLPRFGYFRVHVPPLRERRADIPWLAQRIVDEQAHRFGYDAGHPPRLTAELLTALTDTDWPGNVRELVSALQYLLVSGAGAPELTLAHCDGPLARLLSRQTQAERARLAVETAGSVAAAARKLGVARTTLYRQLQQESTSCHAAPTGLTVAGVLV